MLIDYANNNLFQIKPIKIMLCFKTKYVILLYLFDEWLEFFSF